MPSWKELEHEIKLKLNLALLTVLHTGQVCCNSLKMWNVLWPLWMPCHAPSAPAYIINTQGITAHVWTTFKSSPEEHSTIKQWTVSQVPYTPGPADKWQKSELRSERRWKGKLQSSDHRTPDSHLLSLMSPGSICQRSVKEKRFNFSRKSYTPGVIDGTYTEWNTI